MTSKESNGYSLHDHLSRLKRRILKMCGRRFNYKRVDIKYFFRNVKHIRRMRIRWGGGYKKNVFFFVIDPLVKWHPGLADRIKAIVHCYNIAKGNGFDFKIIYKIPFRLEHYLIPNAINWVADYKDLGDDIWHVKLYNETNWHAHDNKLNSNFEYDCFNYIGNLLPEIFDDTGYQWKDLFNELFKPSKEIESIINNEKMPIPLSYVAVHFRFVNALEHFEEGYYNELSDSKKEKLIQRCKDALLEIRKINDGKDVMVFSDSKVFLDSIKDMPVRTLDDENIGHISFTNDKETIIKTFVDLFVISRSAKVYIAHAPELYNSSKFALLGARIGGIPVEIKDI